MQKDDLRSVARALFSEGVRAADPYKAVDNALRIRPIPDDGHGRQIVIAIGKAAAAMMRAALPHVREDALAVAVVNYENNTDILGCKVFCAGHPIPDENGLRASRQVLKILLAAGPEDHVLCLISGGASALVPAPALGLSLSDKAKTNALMLSSGMEISEINLVRQHLSIFKGGGMRKLASPATVRTLIVSDVIGDDPRAIASGPTATPLGSRADAVNVLNHYGIFEQLPENVQNVLTDDVLDLPETDDEVDLNVICSNALSLKAIENAATHWSPRIVSSELSGNVDQVVHDLVAEAKLSTRGEHRLLIWGGETTVVVKGTGRGGRNQELALRFALAAQDLEGEWVFLSGGTDGRDGPTDAAGELVDQNSLDRLLSIDGDVQNMLANNDSNRALAASGDLLDTGATGTNVADLMLFLRK